MSANQITVPEDREIDLTAILLQLQKNKWLIFIITSIILALGIFYASSQVPQYQASVLLQVSDKRQDTGELFRRLTGAPALPGSINPASVQIALIKSRFILEPVIQSLGLDVSVQALLHQLTIKDLGGRENTGILEMSLINADPHKATRILNAIARKAQNTDTQRKMQETSRTLDFLYKQSLLTKKTLEKAESDLSAYKASPAPSEQTAASLTRDVKIAKSLYLILLDKIQELQVIRASMPGDIHILSFARLPEAPLPDKSRLIYLSSLITGLLLSLLILFIRNLLPTRTEEGGLL